MDDATPGSADLETLVRLYASKAVVPKGATLLSDRCSKLSGFQS